MNKIITYKDTMLTFKNYKEPLREVERVNGYGYYGAILCSLDGLKIQCHMCGELLNSLPGHIQNKHGIEVKEYKKIYQLSPETALVSENIRLGLKQRMLDYIKSMSEEEKEEWKQRQINNLRKGRKERGSYQPKITLETKNKRGTCPDQLLEKIKEVKNILGHTPSLSEFIKTTGGQRYKHLIFTTFGSWKKALSMVGMEVREKELHSKGGKRQSDEYLLEMLSVYARENGRVPTHTDSKRGFIPDDKVYQRRFGSLEKARRLAGVYDVIDSDTLRKFETRSHVRR